MLPTLVNLTLFLIEKEVPGHTIHLSSMPSIPGWSQGSLSWAQESSFRAQGLENSGEVGSSAFSLLGSILKWIHCWFFLIKELLQYCCSAFRWGKGHFKKSLRSKSPATVEHNRALSNMQRSYRRYKLPRTGTFSFGITARKMHKSLQLAPAFSHALLYLNSVVISWYRLQITMLILQIRRLILKEARWLAKAYQLPNARDRGFELGSLSNVKSHVLFLCWASQMAQQETLPAVQKTWV